MKQQTQRSYPSSRLDDCKIVNPTKTLKHQMQFTAVITYLYSHYTYASAQEWCIILFLEEQVAKKGEKNCLYYPLNSLSGIIQVSKSPQIPN